MKLFNAKNKMLFILLIASMAFNILWSMRLESKADELGTIIKQYHDRLMVLEDSFPVPLESFSRIVGSSKIEIRPDSVHLISNRSINIKAKGDINILSENGRIKLNGYEIDLEERAR